MSSGQVYSQRAGEREHILVQAVAAAIVALFLLVGSLWGWLGTGDRSDQIPGATLEIPAGEMTLVEGDATGVEDGIHLRGTGTHERAVLLVAFPDALSNVARFDTLEINLEPAISRPRLTLFWGDPGATTAQYSHTTASDDGRVDLGQLPEWSGELGLLGFGLDGVGGEGVRFDSMVLRDMHPRAGQVLRDLLWHWTRATPFSQTAINAVYPAGGATLISPTMGATLWVLVALALLTSYRAIRRQSFSVAQVLLVVLFVWLVLDLRWQADLVREHRATWEAFRGVPAEQRSFPVLGGEALLDLAARARTEFPHGSRVLIISSADGPGLYARYRLMPLAGLVHDEPSNRVLRFARPGDGLLLLGEAASDAVGLRRELPFAYRARFPQHVGPDRMRGRDVLQAEGSQDSGAAPFVEYQGSRPGTLLGTTGQASPAAVYRAVVRLEVPEVAENIRFQVLQHVAGPDGESSRERVAERVLSAAPGQGMHEQAFGFGLPTRGELELRLRNLPAGTRVEEFRLEYPDDAGEWHMTSQGGQPPYRAGRLVMRNELGLLLELQ